MQPQPTTMGLLLLLALPFVLASCHTPFGIYHTVKKGETLTSISEAYDVPVGTLKKVNYLRDADVLAPGEQLFIPGAERGRDAGPRARTSKSRTQKENAARPKTAPPKRPKAAVPNACRSHAADLRLLWPLEGVLTSPYGDRNGQSHKGIDIAAPTGKVIAAAAAGKVSHLEIHRGRKGYGTILVLDHGYGFLTVYAHLGEVLIKQGESVKRGAAIARVGMTGNSTGPHLHFEVRCGRDPIDPEAMLP